MNSEQKKRHIKKTNKKQPFAFNSVCHSKHQSVSHSVTNNCKKYVKFAKNMPKSLFLVK